MSIFRLFCISMEGTFRISLPQQKDEMDGGIRWKTGQVRYSVNMR